MRRTLATSAASPIAGSAFVSGCSAGVQRSRALIAINAVAGRGLTLALSHREGVIMYKRILVPLDGSETARYGLREAITLAKEQKATLRLIHVISDFPTLVEMDGVAHVDKVRKSLFECGETILQQAKALADSLGVETETQLCELGGGRVADAIVQEARDAGCDLIAIGTHGRRGITRTLLGSDAERVLRQSPVPVLLVREPKKAA
jgi:nucleotide-binding universal stress UspA family protein